MIVKKLVLRNFRNYSNLDLSFDNGLNVITGPNGSGKTNIVEAIYFLSLARSFRTSETTDLIMFKRPFATVEAEVELSSSKKTINALITPSSKKMLVNGKAIKRLSELANLLNVIAFEPKDALMFVSSPIVRRNFLDINLSKKSAIYLENLMNYEKILKERNALLKKDDVDLLELSVLTKQIVDVSMVIDKYRLTYISEINRVLNKIVSALMGEERKALLVYEPFVKVDENFVSNATRAYERAQVSDIKHRVTSLGIHREDIKMLLDDKDIASTGSQGENRLAVIALKLAPYFLVEDKKSRPVIVLDDVLSELDDNHQKRLLDLLRKFEQVFITSTQNTILNASVYEVDKHTVNRRNA